MKYKDIPTKHQAKFHTFYKEVESGCWEWQKGTFGTGSSGRCLPYGAFNVYVPAPGKTKLWLAHRFSWTIHNQTDIPPGFVIMHQCDNPKCVNPDHLRLGTQGENMRDAFKKGRGGRSVHAAIRVTCPHCNKEGGKFVMGRWHFDNCPHKPKETV